jgi:hypothetical protein
MKHLLIYINPIDKKFSKEHEDLTKIQIDNTLSLGVNLEDIFLVTNFSYEYKNVSSTVVSDYSVFDQNRSTKVLAINELFRKSLIDKDEIYWFHDHDAFQLVPFEFKLEEGKDAAFTTHGAYDPVMWNAGSFFFNNRSQDIFLWIAEWMEKLGGTNEQRALTHMWKINFNDINMRSQMIDPSYNLGIYKIPENIKISSLPIKVAHFHPHKKHHLDMYRQILPTHLTKIFANYGIQ